MPSTSILYREHGVKEKLDQDDIGRIERGRTRWPGKWRRVGLRAVLGVASDAELGLYFHRTIRPLDTDRAAAPRAVGHYVSHAGSADSMLAPLLSADQAGLGAERSATAAGQTLGSIRAGLITRRWAVDIKLSDVGLADTWVGARAAHDAYQRADYAKVGQLLPRIVAAGEHLVEHRRGREQQRAHRVLALTYIAVSKLAAKLGDSELAWIAGDRAATSASLAEDQAVGAVADYQIACALVSLPGRLDLAAEIVAIASDSLHWRGDSSDPKELSTRGALLLLGAIIAARQGDRVAAAQNLENAGRLASRLGHDGNHLFTGFGPTNLMIHQVGTAVELHRPSQAIEIGDRLNTSRMPAALVSRRAQVHVDLASAYAQTTGGDSPAVLHLLEVERIAPQVLTSSRACRTLLTRLITRERRTATPGLRALATRAGVLT